ncbi:hypothetical protein B0H63DRAFT_257353 [Podospora didyma]|uniref:DUF2293 domain-containing protein n=1 Tax=Podospora didyma TaxID=330526 RepID=A0AAE0N8L1_9PEZI|nr:hypothetical protein B0H63DRAFT_257353 [Podospora didyma]
MAKDTDNEREVRFFTPIPDGYVFVPKGDVYVTKNCRKRTHEANMVLYVVVSKTGKTLGLRCPRQIFEAVQEDNKATASKRATAVQKRDAALEGNFEEAIMEHFPNTPKEEVSRIIKQALQKHSRRVGRTGKVEVREKVMLAVRAHIRHRHTEYDQLLRGGVGREEARRRILSKLNEVARSWGGRSQTANDRLASGNPRSHKARRPKAREIKLRSGKTIVPGSGRSENSRPRVFTARAQVVKPAYDGPASAVGKRSRVIAEAKKAVPVIVLDDSEPSEDEGGFIDDENFIVDDESLIFDSDIDSDWSDDD